MRLSARLAGVRDTLLRLLPHPTRPGLRAVGRPGPDSPVLLTGNFTLTVRRVEAALAGRDAWLLVADSGGINVWCAAGGGQLTQHDVIAALRASRIGDRVRHRTLVLPQLAATGVEHREVEAATGWRTAWGPAHLEDLPEVMARGLRVRREHRRVRFPLRDRLEMAVVWAVPSALVAAVVLALVAGVELGAVAAGAVAAVVVAIFALLPRLRVWGRGRWAVYVAGAVVGFAAGAAALALLGASSPGHLAWLGGTCAVAMAVLSIDLSGTTPWYPSTVNTWHEPHTLELVTERCTGAADCVQVCPCDVLAMTGPRRRVEIARAEDCILCGACIVQCPEDALRFRLPDGRVVEPATVRRTRLNLLGRRAVEVGGHEPSG